MLAGFGIATTSTGPSSATEGGVQRNENNSSEHSWRMVPFPVCQLK
jgi:hypothetical protein